MFGKSKLFVTTAVVVVYHIIMVSVNAFLFVLGIEVFQLFSAFGAFDVDDIILNCFGVLIGRAVYQILVRKKDNLP